MSVSAGQMVPSDSPTATGWIIHPGQALITSPSTTRTSANGDRKWRMDYSIKTTETTKVATASTIHIVTSKAKALNKARAPSRVMVASKAMAAIMTKMRSRGRVDTVRYSVQTVIVVMDPNHCPAQK
jgi:hypothetical protein